MPRANVVSAATTTAALILGLVSTVGAVGAVALAAAPAAQAASASPTPAPTATGATGKPAGNAVPITFGIRPYRDSDKEEPRAKFQLRGTPGSVINDRVSIFNYAEIPVTLQVYSADGFTSSDGSLALKNRAQKSTGVGTWIKLRLPEKTSLRVAPRTRVDIPVTFTVPKNVTPGDHIGGIVVSLPATTGQTDGTVVQVDNRVATAVQVRVAGEVKAALTIENLTANYSGTWKPWQAGEATVSYDVRNTGNIAQNGRQKVQLNGFFGVNQTATTPDLGVIFPGDVVRVTVPFSSVWPLVRYTGDVAVVPLAATGDPSAEPLRGSVAFWAIPWPQLLTIFVIALLLWLYLRRRAANRKGRRRRGAPTATEPPTRETVDA